MEKVGLEHSGITSKLTHLTTTLFQVKHKIAKVMYFYNLEIYCSNC